jgi:hypothetical protein
MVRSSGQTAPSRARRVRCSKLVRCESSSSGERAVITNKMDRRPVLKAALASLALANVPSGGLLWAEEALAEPYNGKEFEELLTAAVNMHVTAPTWTVLQAVFHDAASYDKEAKTGGFNGSIQFELDRPENAGLKDVVKQVKEAKAMIDASDITKNPITFADTLAIAGLVKLTADFKDHLCGVVSNGSCDLAYNAYGNKPPNMRKGRVDATEADAASVPMPGSSVEEYKALQARMGLGISEITVLSPALTGDFDSSVAILEQDEAYAKALKRYAKTRNDLTRTSYEVPFFKAYMRLVNMGARFYKEPGYF